MTIEEKAKEIVEDYYTKHYTDHIIDGEKYYIGAMFYISITELNGDNSEFLVQLLDDMENTFEEMLVDERIVSQEGIVEVVEQYLHDTVWED